MGRFRPYELTFKIVDNEDEWDKTKNATYNYNTSTVTLKNGDQKFILNVEPGHFSNSEIIVMLGKNGMGKTTLISLLSGHLKPDLKEGQTESPIPKLKVSLKPQKITPKFEGT